MYPGALLSPASGECREMRISHLPLHATKSMKAARQQRECSLLNEFKLKVFFFFFFFFFLKTAPFDVKIRKVVTLGEGEVTGRSH